MPEFLGKPDDQRYVQPVVVDVSLGSRVAGSVIGPKDDDRVVGEAMFLELAQNSSHAVVDLCHRVVQFRVVG